MAAPVAKRSLETSLPPHFIGGLVLAAGFMVFTAWDQSYWWLTKEDYGFGWLVPLFVAYIVYERWPKIRVQVGVVEYRPDQPEAGLGWWLSLAPAVAITALVLGALLFLFGAFYRAAAGATHMSSLAITAGMAAVVLATIYLLAPTHAASPKLRSSQRMAMTALFLFPVTVWLISAPLLSTVDSSLAVFLMHQVTNVVFFVFDGLGLTLEQRGNVLILPTGSVGVEEACSGIRSLTGCLFAGTAVAAVFVDSLGKKVLLVVSSLLFAVGANLMRSIFLTSWAYYHGATSIEGFIHDASGYAVLGLTVVALFGLLTIMDRQQARAGRSPAV